MSSQNLADHSPSQAFDASHTFLHLSRYSIGVGDRFGHQAAAQLRACILTASQGCQVIPVWNKSNREHEFVGSRPETVMANAKAAVAALSWKLPFHVDADHINLRNVEGFLACSDYFTLDVADAIGHPADPSATGQFVARHAELFGEIRLPNIAQPLNLSSETVRATAEKYLFAAQEAGRIYRRIATAKAGDPFITEVSMDETDSPQTPAELLVILAALSDENIPLQTIAPKFSGRFNKGVDYVGDGAQFEAEFRADIAVIAHAIATYPLPANLKLSIHSGSDKFSIYPVVRRAIREFNAGVHLKTAGTTWLEELIGLAEADGDGLILAKEIYALAYQRRQQLCAPYATVIDIEAGKLPLPETVRGWQQAQFVKALRHDQSRPEFNPSFRQLLHVAYKIAAEMGPRYHHALDAFESSVARNVTANLYERHLRPLFLD